METLQAIATRRSCRNFSNRPLEADKLNTILKAGCAAPVGLGDFASLCITAIQNTKLLQAITNEGIKQLGRDPIYKTPVLVLVSARPGKIENIEYCNAACVLENMLLAATDLGVDSIFLWAAAVVIQKSPELLAKFTLPEGFRPIASAALGYGTKTPVPRETLEPRLMLYSIL